MDSFKNHGYDADGLDEYKKTNYPKGGGDEMEKNVVQQQKDYEEKMGTEKPMPSETKQIIPNRATPRQNRGKKRRFRDGDSEDETSVLSQAPREVNISAFAKSRASEMELLTKIVLSKNNKRNPLQNMPRHMRRRAASHNIKRLPRRLRMQAVAELENAGKKPKTPSRYHRRRPKNLLAEYNRRQKKQTWLETHIWHAKRFHMIEKWSYKIPHYPNDKSLRAIYRATSKYAVLKDMSYFGCIEVSGSLENILHGLEKLTEPKMGPTFGDKSYTGGTRQGSVIIHKADSCPQQAIGEVLFNWKPCSPDQRGFENLDCSQKSSTRTIWIWVHPSFWEEAFVEIKAVFPSNLPEDGKKENEDNQQLEQNLVTVKTLKDNILRYRLSGPMSTLVLGEVLKPANLKQGGDEISAGADEKGKNRRAKKWWTRFYSEPEIIHCATQQEETWRGLCKQSTPVQAPPGGILGLTVRDPRLLLPPKKNVIDEADISTTGREEGALTITPEIADSPIWSQIVRDEVKFTQLPQSELNRRKGEMLVPGSVLDLGEDESRIPILLVQNPGFNMTQGLAQSQTLSGFGSGWDIIIPSVWGMPFWIGLVYQGARVGGLRELNSGTIDRGLLRVPYDYPDTPAGNVEERTEWEELEAKYKRYPPAKRPNYVKLGVTSPFCYPWLRLVKEWACILSRKGTADIDQKATMQDTSRSSPSSLQNNQLDKLQTEILDSSNCSEIKEFVVMRTRKELEYLDSLCHRRNSNSDGNGNASRGDKTPADTLSNVNIGDNTKRMEIWDKLSQMHNVIVPVVLNLVGRGAPSDHSMICIPTREDLTNLAKDERYGGPLEPKHQDPSSRRQLKKQNRKKQKLTKPEPMDKVTNQNVQDALVEPKDVVTTPSRLVIGYLKSGGFTYSTGRGTGRGFCALQGILYALEHSSERNMKVLLRSPNSHQYRFAYMKIHL